MAAAWLGGAWCGAELGLEPRKRERRKLGGISSTDPMAGGVGWLRGGGDSWARAGEEGVSVADNDEWQHGSDVVDM